MFPKGHAPRKHQVVLWVGIVLWAGTASAQELVEYTVQDGDTCASIARRFYGDSRAYDRIHAHNPTMGPPPHRLAPGTVLRLPRAETGRALSSPDANVSAARRRVTARGPRAERWQPAQVGQALHGGWQVATHDASSAVLTFRDESVLEMRQHTLVVIYGGSRSLARRTDARATLERGALRSRLSELAGVVDIETPTSRAQVGSGNAIVTVDEEGTSRLANLGGRAATVTTDRGRVRVPAGTGTIVRRGQAPTPPRPLPPPPVWSNDLAGRFVGLTGRGATLRGSWEPVEGAARYRVEVAAQPDGSDVVAAVEVSADVTEMEVHRLPPGVYYVSVATIDEGMFEGLPSPLRAMQVSSARIIPPGGTEPVEEPYDPGDPSRPPSMPRVLPGTWVVAPIGMKCAAGDERPREMITLRASGPTRVRCFDPADREIPGFEVLVLRVRTRIEEGARIERGVPTDVRLRLDPELPPGVHLAASADGAQVGRPRRTHDGAVVVPVTPAHDTTASSIPLRLSLIAADETIEIAATTLTVADPLTTTDEMPPITGDEDGDLRPSALLLDAMVVPAVALRHSVERGFAAWASAGTTPSGQHRGIAVGGRARVFDTPWRVGVAWSIARAGADPMETDVPGSVRIDVASPFFHSAGVVLSASLEGRSALRALNLLLAPGLELDWAVVGPLTLRARLAATARDQDGASWALGAAFAGGAELVLTPHLAASVEAASDSQVPVVLSLAGRLSPFELVLGTGYARAGELWTQAVVRVAFTR